VKPSDFGILGMLEAARQALEESGEAGLSSRNIMEAAGFDVSESKRGSRQTFIMQLGMYCAVYESDDGRRFYLNTDIDENFIRRITPEGKDVFTSEGDIYE